MREKVGRAISDPREKGWHEKSFYVRKEKKRKEERKGAGSFVSTLGFLPRVREVRRWATSVVSPPNFRKIFNILSSMFADDLKHPKNWQTSIEGVRSASAVERALQRASTREESIRPRALCGWSTEARHTVWLYHDDQTLSTVIRLRWSTTRTKILCSEHITVKCLLFKFEFQI